jgi:hypothetical protein
MLLVTLGLAFVAGCGESEQSSPGAAAPGAKRENAAPPTATPSPAVDPAPPREPPASDGDGPVAANLDPKPAAHSDAAYMDTLSDEHLILVISKGGPAIGKSSLMAGWAGTLDASQIVDVVAYIRTLSQ